MRRPRISFSLPRGAMRWNRPKIMETFPLDLLPGPDGLHCIVTPIGV